MKSLGVGDTLAYLFPKDTSRWKEAFLYAQIGIYHHSPLCWFLASRRECSICVDSSSLFFVCVDVLGA